MQAGAPAAAPQGWPAPPGPAAPPAPRGLTVAPLAPAPPFAAQPGGAPPGGAAAVPLLEAPSHHLVPMPLQGQAQLMQQQVPPPPLFPCALAARRLWGVRPPSNCVGGRVQVPPARSTADQYQPQRLCYSSSAVVHDFGDRACRLGC